MSFSLLLSSLLSPWGAFQVAALVAGALLMRKTAPRWLVALPLAYLCAAIGAVGLGALLRLPRVLLTGAPFALEIMSFGALGGLCLGMVMSDFRRRREALEAIALPAALMVTIARCGCFVAGCDYGSIAGVPWAVRYGPGTPAYLAYGHVVSIHPTQLYEAFIGIAMLLIGWRARERFLAVALTYAAGRFVIELFRADPNRGFVGPLSMPQLLCLTVAMLCAAHYAGLRTVRAAGERFPRA